MFNQVYFSSFPAPPVLNLAVGGDPKHALRWLRDTTGLQAARQADFAIGGRPYKLFVEPLRLDGDVTWLLCGAVPAEQFNAECRALPGGLLEAALVLILLAILAMPFLKTVLMGPRERLNRFDVVLCGFALVLATTFLMLECVDSSTCDYFLNSKKAVMQSAAKHLACGRCSRQHARCFAALCMTAFLSTVHTP